MSSARSQLQARRENAAALAALKELRQALDEAQVAAQQARDVVGDAPLLSNIIDRLRDASTACFHLSMRHA